MGPRLGGLRAKGFMDSTRQARAPAEKGELPRMEARFRETLKKTPFRGLVAFFAFSVYKMMIAPFLHSLGGTGFGCRYPQTCSEFAALSILEHGVMRGTCRAFQRVCSCNPWTQPQAHLLVATPKEAVS